MRRTALLLIVLLLALAACQPAAIEVTATPSETPIPPVSATETPDATATPRPLLTPRATLPPEQPSETPTQTLTVAPTRMRTDVPTITPTPTLTSTPTFTSTFTPTDTATFTPTATFTASSTPTPTMTPSLVRTPGALLPFGAHFTYTTNGLSSEWIDLSGGNIESWLWDFGDGTTSDTSDSLHRYAAGGRYVVKLTIRDENGLSSTALRAIDIVPHTCVLAPHGRARVHLRPSANSQTIFFLIGSHRATAIDAVYDANGEIWYKSGDAWLRGIRVWVESGTCPTPPEPEE